MEAKAAFGSGFIWLSGYGWNENILFYQPVKAFCAKVIHCFFRKDFNELKENRIFPDFMSVAVGVLYGYWL